LKYLHIDFETRSAVDLRKTGLHRYATDPSTDLWCACWELDGVEGTWRPGDPMPDLLADTIYAHNAGFEYAIWLNILGPRYGWPVPRIEQFRCTAAMAAAMSLPRDLGSAALAAGLDQEKDQAGRRLMLQMSKPRNPRAGEPKNVTLWWDDDARVQRLIEYCRQDVRTEVALSKKLRPLSDKEHALWVLDHKINSRGVRVDLGSVRKAILTVAGELDRLNTEMQGLTGGEVGSTNQVSRITAWLVSRGIEMPTLGKQAVADAMADDTVWTEPEDEAFTELWGALPTKLDTERRVLEIRLEAAKSSTAKLKRFLDRAEQMSDGWICRENFLYHGAGTGRWSGLGLQMQNFPRGALNLKPDDIDDALAHLTDREWLAIFYGAPMTVISDCLRSLLIARKGRRLVVADYANIEGRGLPWLAGDERKLTAFRAADAKTGPGIYERAAAGIFGVKIEDVTKPQRQIGKTSELACGYGGGVGAFQSMAKNLGVKVPDAEADKIKSAWRESHPEIVNYWYALERAAMNAVREPGSVFSAGAKGRESAFKVAGNVLWLRLPSSRVIAYPDPKIKPVETPWGEMKDAVTFMGVDAKTHKWSRQKTYGGSLAENVTQAICRDLLAEAITRLESAGYPIVMHAHDEAVADVPKGFGSLKEFEAIMCASESWAAGMPVVSEGYEALRYRK
jgi:DNA polymerase